MRQWNHYIRRIDTGQMVHIAYMDDKDIGKDTVIAIAARRLGVPKAFIKYVD